MKQASGRLSGHKGRNQPVSGAFIVLIILSIACLLFGGGAREDITSLVILRPLSVIALGFGIYWLRRDDFARYKPLFYLLISCTALVVLNLIPLPPALWMQLPGRDLVVDAASVARIDQPWRPISLVPWRSWNALFALAVPAAALCLAARCSADEQRSLITVVLIGAAMSMVFAVLQIVSGADFLYLYKVTNNGSPVGLFANRNHQAVLLDCLFPLLAVYASLPIGSEPRRSLRRAIALAGIVILIPLQLITGSRAGLLLMVPAFLTIFLIYRGPVSDRRHGGKKRLALQFALGLVFLILVGLTVIASRATALERLLHPDVSDNLRFDMLKPNLEMGWKYFPVGSGVGTFLETFQIDQPQQLLTTSYPPHAHNDPVEVWMTTGLAGVILMFAGLLIWLKGGWIAFRSGLAAPVEAGERLARAGWTIVGLLLVASFADYPLRVPTMSLFLVISAVWAVRQGHTSVPAIAEGVIDAPQADLVK